MSATDMIAVGEPLPLIASVHSADLYSVVVEWLSGPRNGITEQLSTLPLTS